MSEIITRQEAAEIVRTFREVMDTPVTEHREILLGALDMAIEELEKDPKSVVYLCKYHKEGHECKHTSRIEDALNFEEVAPGKFVEVEKIPVNIIPYDLADELREKIEDGEVYLAPAPVEATTAIMIHNSGRTFRGFHDKNRHLIFGSYMSEEIAEQFGWTWEEAEEQKLGGDPIG